MVLTITRTYCNNENNLTTISKQNSGDNQYLSSKYMGRNYTTGIYETVMGIQSYSTAITMWMTLDWQSTMGLGIIIMNHDTNDDNDPKVMGINQS